MSPVRFTICLSFFSFFFFFQKNVIDFGSEFLYKKVLCASRFAKSKQQ